MSGIWEDHIEQATLEWLEGLGYVRMHGDDLSPGGDDAPRKRYSDVVLRPRLRDAVTRLNPDITLKEVDAAVDALAGYASQSIVDGNREVYDWLRNGVPVERVDAEKHRTVLRVRVIDADGKNDLLAVQQFTVHGQKVRRPDVILFVNGLPLVVIELKNPADINADIEAAYNQIQTYKADIPQLFYFNLLNVISDGTVARYGSLSADLSRHARWRLLGGKKVSSAQLELEVLIRGLLEPKTLIDFFRGFVAYGGSDGGATYKIVAQWHQYHGVLRAVERAVSALHKRDGKGGVIWFTQGSGKSLLALFYVMALRERPEFENPTVVMVTDRNDLDGQLFDTFADCRASLGTTPVKASGRDDLREKLSEIEAGGVFFTTINKFAPDPGKNDVAELCSRTNVIVVTDEAHRTQYGFKATLDTKTGETKYGLAKYMRQALPNAIYLGMTGTPVSLDDRDTEGVFGTYVDIYDMIAAQEDEAVVPISYESRIIELKFNDAEKQALMNEFLDVTGDEDQTSQDKTVSRLTRLEAIAMAEGRLEALAKDFVAHWEARKEQMDGKAMLVAISREACVRLYNEIVKLRPEWHNPEVLKGRIKVVMTANSADPLHFQAHRLDAKQFKKIEKRFKDATDPLEIVIVRDMWLTGFDAPPVNTLYVDKPMQGHGLMQAIARTNRVWRDKPGGLIVDYIGIGEELKAAIKQYTRDANSNQEPVDTSGQALKILLDTIDVIRKEFFHGFDYAGHEDPKKALSLLAPAMEHLLQVDPKEDEKGRNRGIRAYLDQVAKLTKAQALAGTTGAAMALREEIAFFQALRVSLIKLTRAGLWRSQVEKEAALRQLVAKGVLVEGVNDIFTTLGLGKPDISVLDEAFLAQIQAMPTKNLAAELLERLIADQIKARGQKNAIQGKEFATKLEEAIGKYQARAITTAEVIEQLIKLAKEINASKPPTDMSEEEFAFYQALCENESAVREMGEPVLRSLAFELTDKLKKSAVINWQNRKSTRAKMIAMVAAHLGAVETLKPEESVKTDLLSRIQAMRAASANGEWTQAQIQQAVSSLEGALPRQPGKTSKLVPAVKETIDALSTWQAEMQVPAPEHQPGVEDLVVKALPKFIHYSNYGNLDSEIYLPHVVANLKRSDLGAKEGAKARTLRVLFNYVRLKPEEILELGQDFKDPSNPHRAPTDAEIDAIAKKKRERSILLHSADADLTSRFREWWKQGNYRFHFEADGNHFRIWVADDQRPENIELEARSTGLQWFFSFFLVFLVEATGEHKNAVLLLDEPGLSLHPIAQRDLSAFFDSLAETNQLVYTTHSPFLVDADRLDRVKKVYADSSGATVATSDLRKGVSGSAEAGAAYAVYSALNMSLAESLLLGCEPVIVEGPSDQHYLTLIKVLLISANKISPAREFVFPPAGGTKTLKTTAAILTGRDDALPFVLLDNDAPGARMAKELSTSLYEAEKDKVLLTDRFTGIERSEIEDLIPTSVYVEAIDKEFRLADEPFSDHVKPYVPIVPQVEIWAKNQSVELPKGWKVDVARRIKSAMLKRGIDSVPPDVVDRWTDLFQALEGKPSK